MIGTPEERKHLDQLARERIYKRHEIEALLDVIDHRIESFYREVELGDLLGDLDTDAGGVGMAEWLSKHLVGDLGRDLKAVRAVVKESCR